MNLPLATLDAGLRGLLLGWLGLLALRLWRDRRGLAAAQAGAALSCGLMVQVLSSAPWFEAGLPVLWQLPWIGISVGNALLFLFFVQALFDDEFRWRRWQGLTWLASVSLITLKCWWFSEWIGLLQRGLPLACAALAVHAALRQRSDDLVERRRALRGFMVWAGAVYSVIQVAARLASGDGRLSQELALLDMLALVVVIGGVAVSLLQLVDTELLPPALEDLRGPREAHSTDAGPEARVATAEAADSKDAPSQDPANESPADARLAQTLQRLMQTEQVYRSEGLSLTTLAARLAVPEYRLRRVINQRLGHRNFNSYVNGWRLDAAQAALSDPAQRGTAVLSIALEAGFQSIGPFNRAFKASTGLTPSEFRRRRLAES